MIRATKQIALLNTIKLTELINVRPSDRVVISSEPPPSKMEHSLV